VITNYSYWLEHPDDMGYFTTLVLDEAHKAPDEISRFAAIEIRASELERLHIDPPPDGKRAGVQWALMVLDVIDTRGLTKEGGEEHRRLALRLRQKLSRMCKLSEHQWLRSRGWKTWRWDLVDPSALAEDLLFRKAKKVVLSSASLRKKTLRLLGVEGGRGNGVTVIEQESTFPLQRRPVWFWPVAKLNRGTSRSEFDRWHEAIDEVIEERLDRNGLIHTVSYERAVTIWQRSKFQDRMIIHEKKQGIEEVVAEWRKAPMGTVLLSPALTEGVNLAYQDCEYAIIAKLPFPDFTAPLMRARSELDATYTAYLTWQALVQAVGRHMRAVDDQGETFILDSALRWMKVRYPDFAPRWFHTAVRTIGKDKPAPLPPTSLHDQDPNRWGRV
jgi:Rad3-related DNA helicase